MRILEGFCYHQWDKDVCMRCGKVREDDTPWSKEMVMAAQREIQDEEVSKVRYFTTGNEIDFQSDGAAGVDLHIQGDHTIQQGEVHVLNTGIWAEIPEGFVGEVTMRSSYAKKGLFIPNAPGLVDSDYRGEIKILVANLKPVPVEIVDGHRVAQITWRRVDKLPMERVKRIADLTPTKRGTGAMGSTGA